MFSGVVRNKGIEAAKGEFICYLDADDIMGADHLTQIDDKLNGYDWVFFNDLIYSKGAFEERFCSIKHYACGTSNIAHKRLMRSRWKNNAGYGRDDWDFILDLKTESTNWVKIPTPEYIVCHIPKEYDL
jgi:glycosyltransferase involved in cell wall biosynthesis